MKDIQLFLVNKYRKLKKIFFLYKVSSQIGVDNVIAVINLIENDYGHQKSVLLGKPVDASLNPVPWYTYPAIEYLGQFDFSAKNIFEYGCGNSSIFWAKLANSVTSVEIDTQWYENINSLKPNNLNIQLRISRDSYISSIQESNTLYDLVIIDGIYRYECARKSIQYLAMDGLLILDNSERYPKLCEEIRKHDLLQVDFFGYGPINYYTWTTSIFFRRECRLEPLNSFPRFGIGSLCQEFNESES